MQQVLSRSIAVGLAALTLTVIAIRPGSPVASGAPLPARHAHKSSQPTRTLKFNRVPTRSAPRVESAVPQATLESSETVESNHEVNAVFDFSALNAEETAWATEVVGSTCDYDWGKLAARLNDRKVKIELGSPSARGMFYPADLRVEVHRYYYKAERKQASRILAWELAHSVDFVSMSTEQRQHIIELYGGSGTDEWLAGPYEDQIGEAFMEGFVAAFCKPVSARSNYFSHSTTPEVAQGIRQVLL